MSRVKLLDTCRKIECLLEGRCDTLFKFKMSVLFSQYVALKMEKDL